MKHERCHKCCIMINGWHSCPNTPTQDKWAKDKKEEVVEAFRHKVGKEVSNMIRY